MEEIIPDTDVAGSPDYTLSFVDRDGVRYLPILGEFDIANADALEAFIITVRHDSKPLVIDLSKTTYIDSTVLTVLIRQKKLAGAQIRIVVPMGAKVRRIFEVTDLDRLLDVKPSLAEALTNERRQREDHGIRGSQVGFWPRPMNR